MIRACRKHGKSAGRLVPTVDEGVAFHEAGFDFICYSGDVWALHGAVQQAVNEIRERAAPASRRTTAQAKDRPKRKTVTGGGDEQVPGRAQRRFQEGGRQPGVSRFRPVAARAEPGGRA